MEELRLTKELRTLTIDPGFRDLIPPLSDTEGRMLEESIVANGCESPLIVWNNTIVDGHNRYEICQKHSIPFAVIEKDFEKRDAVLIWIIQTQLGRRNLTAFQKAELALVFEPLMKEQAKERQIRKAQSGSFVPPNLAEQNSDRETREKIAGIAGISHGTLAKVKKLIGFADESTLKKLRGGDMSISSVYSELMKKERADDTKVCERCHQEKQITEFSIPSNRRGFSSICKDCTAEIKNAAKLAVEAAAAPLDSVEDEPIPSKAEPVNTVTYEPKPHGNFSTLGELRDTPEHFPKVAELFRRTLDSCYNGIDINLRQYKPSMVNEENTKTLRAMIEASFMETLEVFDNYIAVNYGRM